MDENQEYLTNQLITYIGNKRSLINEIENQVKECVLLLKKPKCICVDLFSGSGVVSRMLKKYSSVLIANDLEEYAYLLNQCYLSNKEDFDTNTYNDFKRQIDIEFDKLIYSGYEGIISQNYAPKDDNNIKKGERVFYTRDNALRIDVYRKLIDDIVDDNYKKFFLAPLLTECSIHTNTSGVFKGFYKDKRTGIGSFGGTAKNALSRITGQIQLPMPILSNFTCQSQIYAEDAIELSKKLGRVDIVYLDPPYNQHPYGSNYFMLNLILKNKIDSSISKVSGIVDNWNRSVFNKNQTALCSLEEIIKNLDAKYIIISYNSEGFISFDQMKNMLKKYGNTKIIEIKYNTFRGSRNLRQREIHVSEYLFVLECNKEAM